jgi:hypothetical protein
MLSSDVMRHKHILLAAVLLVGVYPPSPLGAQTPGVGAPQNDCTYALCAFRVEPGLLGPRLVRGTNGASVRLGTWGSGVARLAGRSDSATVYAARYVRATRQSSVLGVLGTIGYATVLVRTHVWRDRINNGDAIIAVAGGGLLLATVPFGVRAQRNLSRAVWWYNATLPR